MMAGFARGVGCVEYCKSSLSERTVRLLSSDGEVHSV